MDETKRSKPLMEATTQATTAKLLVVDDDPMILCATVRVLRSDGYEVIETQDSRTCLELVHRERPDVILLDVDMPKPDGFTLCRQIKETTGIEDVLVVLISGQKTYTEDLKQGLESSLADGYILRPVSNTALLARLKAFVRIQKLQKDLRNSQAQLREQKQRELELVERELTHVRDELVRSTRLAAIGQISASIGHDLRNPLAAIHNAVYLLRRKADKDPQRRDELLDMISAEVTYANQIIANLMAVARSKPPVRVLFDIRALLQEQCDKALEGSDVQVRIKTENNPFMLWIDPAQFKQVVQNIISNARQAMKTGGVLTINASHEKQWDLLEFRDTGTGLADEILENLFEPLVTTRATGTGLGLTICKQIVEGHDGTIEAESLDTGGTLIRIRLRKG